MVLFPTVPVVIRWLYLDEQRSLSISYRFTKSWFLHSSFALLPDNPRHPHSCQLSGDANCRIVGNVCVKNFDAVHQSSVQNRF